MARLQALLSQLLPEPAPVRPYVHPSKYCALENVRHFSDGMHKAYEPNIFTKAFSILTLGLYVGIPHIMLALLCFSWYRPALIALCLMLGTLLIPAKPLRVQAVLNNYMFLCWRRYFKFSFLFEQSLGCYKDYVIAQFPHGAFPVACLLGGKQCHQRAATCMVAQVAIDEPMLRGWRWHTEPAAVASGVVVVLAGCCVVDGVLGCGMQL
eukprot:GHRR01004453.1.p2 GENE.GHRR01004453.1~~GHRR01004453.1.p2  ORF type:complete len:209 (+),score=35.82 GHRR01004453.1:157-783(+)